MPPDTEMRPLVMRIVREAHQWAGSQEKLLAAIKPLLGGVVPTSTSSLSNWESGSDRPTGEAVLAMAMVAGISLDELLYGKSLQQEMRALADRIGQLESRETA